MRIVVTGGIGTGKSTFNKMLCEKIQYDLFDFDKEVHELYKDKQIRKKLEKGFGTHIKSDIGNIVFHDKEKMQTLKNIFNEPLLERTLEAFQKENVILDIPLFFENRESFKFTPDLCICLLASENTQIKRVMERNGFTEKKIRDILKNQIPAAQKAKLGDVVVENNGTLQDLEREVNSLSEKINNQKIKKPKV